MPIPRFPVWFVLGLVVLRAGWVSGQNYPNKPVRIVTSGAGAGTDFVARIIAQGISDGMGQPVIVDNRAQITAAEIVSKAPPDGYTLYVGTNALWLGALLEKIPYDPVKDFSPISLTNQTPNVLVVNPSLPVKSVKELIALAKSEPGKLNYSSSAIGGSAQLAAELFKSMAGVNIVGIQYKSAGPAILAVLGGQLDLTFQPAGGVTSQIKSGRLRGLAVTSLKPSALVPGLPTVAASGLPGYEVVSIYGLWAPAKTPATIVNRLNQEIGRMLSRSDVKERFLNGGVEIVGSSPEELAITIRSEMAKWSKVIKEAGIATS